MKKRTSALQAGHLLLETLTITGLYVTLGKACLLLAHSLLSGNIILFWPPVGLALAAFMLLGWRASAGVWLGAIGTQAGLISGEINLHVVVASVAIASGSTAQAALAAWLTGRLLGLGKFATPASGQRMLRTTPLRIATCMATLFVLATMLAPSIGTASLVLSGDVPRSAAATLWHTWWLGDLTGMLGFGPLLYFLARYWRKEPFLRDQIVICLACLLAGAGVMAFGVNQQSDRFEQLAVLKADLNELIALENGLTHSNVTQVISLKALFEASDDVRLDEFQKFTAKQLAHDPSTRSLSWLPRVQASERAGFEQKIKRSGRPDFFIQERGANHTRIAAGVRPDYFPITYLMPADSNARLTGLDIGMDPVRHDAIERARDSGTPEVSGPVKLMRSVEPLPGVVLAAAVYRQGLPITTVAERRFAFAGVVLSAYSPNRRFTEIRGSLRPKGIELFVFDQAPGPDGLLPRLIAWSTSETSKTAQPPTNIDPNQLRQGLYVERSFEFAGRERLIIVRPDSNATMVQFNWDGWLLMVFAWVLA
ncbi:MAG: CHASE domain-containing protein, partial [Chitinophagaceae bacterium]|nr:CHASE domain-containing protein [Polaromonas sp.]